MKKKIKKFKIKKENKQRSSRILKKVDETKKTYSHFFEKDILQLLIKF